MKKILSALFALTIVIAACNNSKPKDGEAATTKDGTEQVTTSDAKTKAAEEALEKKKEELTNLTPLTEDKLSALLPEQLSGAAKTNVDISSGQGAMVASADYKTSDSSEIKLTVIDCGGPGGVGIYNMHIGSISMQEENTKITDYKGEKAIEHCDTEENTCTFTYFTGRFLITLEGDNVNMNGLKQAAKGVGY